MKKILKVVLIGVLPILLMILLIIVSITALRCITTKGKLFSGYYLAYEINDDRDTCTITNMVFTVVREIDIPETIDGYRVTRIKEDAFNELFYVFLKSVTIPDSVTKIDRGAFSYVSPIVQKENGVSYVDKWVIRCDPTATSVILRDDTVGIAAEAFKNCKGQSIVIPASVIYYNDYPVNKSLIYYGGTASDANNMDDAYYNQRFDLSCWHYFSETLPSSTDYAYWHYVDGVPTVWNVIEYSANDDGTCYVSRARVGGDFDIPNISPDGKTVTGIGDHAFYECWTLTSVTIPHGITSIGKGAFSRCCALTNITIPYGVTSIGEETFYECSNLTSITIPDGVTYIGERAFAGCSSLTSITISDDVTSIGYAAFNGCGSLTNVYITDLAKWCEISFEDTSANPLAFAQNLYLNGELITNLVIAEGITKISNFAFSGYNGLTSVTIGNDVESIGAAFSSCENLTSVTIGTGVKIIQTGTFDACSSLTDITIGDNVAVIGSVAFRGCTALTNLTIPNRVTNIEEQAFADCTSLTSITIPESVTSISASTFWGCDKLIQNDNGVFYIDKWVVDCDTSLTNVVLRENTVGICEGAFSGCRKLENIEIPNSIMYIEADAFESCPNLNYNQYDDAYYLGNNDNPRLVLMKTITDDITSFEINESTKIIYTSAFESCKLLTRVIIPNSVTSIGANAFKNCDALKNVTIPDSVISIGGAAFEGCDSFTRIIIPDSVTSIGASAFSDCDEVTSIILGKNITVIRGSAFSSCGMTSITIPDGVITIGTYAFGYCYSLRYVTLPNSIMYIGYEAFYATDLVSITYNGTIEEWEAIGKGKKLWGNSWEDEIIPVICLDGTIKIK